MKKINKLIALLIVCMAMPALSAGRVQSVAVRLIVEREREVHAFVSEPSYRVTAVFEVPEPFVHPARPVMFKPG